MADHAVRRHVIAVADIAGLGVRGRRGQAYLIKIAQPDDAGIILADTGIVHDHASS
jgi:hypothetical protein